MTRRLLIATIGVLALAMSPVVAVATRISLAITRRCCGAIAAAVIAVLAAGTLSVAVAEATTGSILYRKSGKLWVSGPDGKRARAIPRSRALDNPSQDDKGTIVAQRGFKLHRINRGGPALNKPFAPAFSTHPAVPAFKGPL